ncbi:GerAB/ArcD/ProY family transporter [Bacillus suaedaesalsae]|uniref:GerAB/ArcD/ProY family transporter n=1 Tax=Bacillus suaedaesalsae TaxID=2810349 RepID=A0ABS2DMB8_9BACI|nr:GerAB/ArcD/ProY family transporter [Bacillus suaedaesalsae]MBM6619608.1 GerAB/ArcD/ProY family transporter [Bacillus suaedaesalsae]
MKTKISPFQLAIIIANFILTGSLMITGQIITQITKHTTWQVPFFILPLLLGLLFIGMGRKGNLVDVMPSASKSKRSKIFSILMSIFLMSVFIRDVRTFVHYISSNLLPTTPLEIITLILVITLVYISAAGLEVIGRITVIQFVVLAAIILTLPLTLINELKMSNLLPIFEIKEALNLGKSSFILFPWMGEVFIVFYLFSNIQDTKGLRKATYYGTAFGILLYFVLLILNILVLGEKIVRLSSYPNITMIQQINITEFLDRLDLVIVLIWMPCLIAKLALTLYLIQKAIANIRSVESVNIILPLGLLLGVLSIVLFKSTMVFFEFTFFSWTLIGLFLEMSLLVLFLISRKKKRKAEST